MACFKIMIYHFKTKVVYHNLVTIIVVTFCKCNLEVKFNPALKRIWPVTTFAYVEVESHKYMMVN